MSDQPRLFQFRMGERSPDSVVVTEANRDAAHLLTQWRSWPNGALALVGPAGAGKTHLALAWALEAGARQLSPTAPAEKAAALFRVAEGRLLIDDASGPRDEDMLWRLLDLARTGGGAVLLVGTEAPARWAVSWRKATVPAVSTASPELSAPTCATRTASGPVTVGASVLFEQAMTSGTSNIDRKRNSMSEPVSEGDGACV